MSSVAGRLCRCGRDEAGTSFIYITHPELHGYEFCNNCGLVYGPDSSSEPDEPATEKFQALGMPEYDGQGRVSDPLEWEGLEGEVGIALPRTVFSKVRYPGQASDPVVVLAELTQVEILLQWVPSEERWEHAPELENDYLYGNGNTYKSISEDEAEQLIRDITYS